MKMRCLSSLLTALFLFTLVSPLTVCALEPPTESSFSGGISKDGTAYVTLSPADDTLLYALIDGDGWHAPQSGAVTWYGLDADGLYQLVCKPQSDTGTAPEDAEACTSFYAPAPAPRELLRKADSDPRFDCLQLIGTSPNCEYALIDAAGQPIQTNGQEWQTGEDTLDYYLLDSQQEYTVLARHWSFFSSSVCISSETAVPVLSDIVSADRLSGWLDVRGRGCIAVTNSHASMQYAALTVNGSIAALGAGNGSQLTLSGLIPGREYYVTARSVDELLLLGEKLLLRGTALELPTVRGELGLMSGLTDDQSAAFIEINPACPEAFYAVVDVDGVPLPGVSAFDKSGTAIVGEDGWFCTPDALRFEALSLGTVYWLSLRDASGLCTPLAQSTTPDAALSLPQKTAATITADSLSFTGQRGLHYALADSAGLSLLTGWQSGTGQALLFSGLTSGANYTLVARADGITPILCFAFSPQGSTPSIPDPPPSSGGGSSSGPVTDPVPGAPLHADGADRLLITDKRIAYIEGDTNGLCHAEGSLTRAEMCAIFFRLLREVPPASASTYTDVPAGAWHERYVMALSTLGIVQGTGGGRFQPDAPLTRAEFAALAARFCNTVKSDTLSFSDLAPTHWAYPHAVLACTYGWLQLDETGAFHPDEPISRGEAVHALNLLLGRAPDVEALNALTAPPTFGDLKANSPWYYDMLEAALSE